MNYIDYLLLLQLSFIGITKLLLSIFKKLLIAFCKVQWSYIHYLQKIFNSFPYNSKSSFFGVFIIGFKVTNIFFLIGSTIFNFLLIVHLRFNRRDGRIWGAMVDSTSLSDFTFYPIKYSFFFQITTQCMAIQGPLMK